MVSALVALLQSWYLNFHHKHNKSVLLAVASAVVSVAGHTLAVMFVMSMVAVCPGRK